MMEQEAETTTEPTASVGTASVSSAVMRVSDVDVSAKFYCDVFGCRIAIRGPDTALLLTSKGFQIYLYSNGPARRRRAGTIGVRHLTWTTDDESEFRRISERLREHDPATYSHTEGELTFAEGCDPEGQRVIVVYPSPSALPRESIAARFQW